MAKGLHLRGGETREVFDKEQLRQFLINKYYNLFMNRFSSNLTNEQHDYVMRSFWGRGTVAAFRLRGTEDDNAENLVFTDYAPAMYNIYDFPTKVTLINKRGVRFIPSTMQDVNKKVVLGFIQRNKKSVYSQILPLIDKIVRAEITLEQNLRALRTPFLYATTTETEKKFREYENSVDNGTGSLFVSSEDIKGITVFNSGVQPIIDKLVNYISKVDSDIKEYLGIANLGVNEKKEHLITAEVESNNEVTEETRTVFKDMLDEFAAMVGEVLGVTLTFTDKHEEEQASEGEEYEEV